MMTFITENTFLAQITTYCSLPMRGTSHVGYPCRGCGAVPYAQANTRPVADMQVRLAISRIINLGAPDKPLRS
jgi:hypothetical protein